MRFSNLNFKPCVLAVSATAFSLMLGGCGGTSPMSFNQTSAMPTLEPNAPQTSAKTPAQQQTLTAQSALDTYIARPEPAYKWEKVAAQTPAQTPADANNPLAILASGAQISELKLTSQTWQGAAWTHRVQIFRPEKVEYPDTAFILVSYGGGSPMETLLGQLIANATGATFVQLFDVPNQPLFGMREDDLIAHTFQKYLETGDKTWPLLFPMTKSVVKTMDAVQEFSGQEWKTPIKKFVIGGASKRGWTTWLAGAEDPRVIGIVPMVYNNLNLAAQMPHQIETWGKYSPQIEDYTRRGLQAQLQTPKGQMLAAMVDPYTFRDRLTMPKLLINATNDPYWTLDSLSLYRKDLKGQTNVFYAPNAGHPLNGQEQAVFGSIAGWFRKVVKGESLPNVELLADEIETNGARSFGMKIIGQKQRLWVARSATRDFRGAKWTELPFLEDRGTIHAEVPPAPASMKFTAVIGEVDLPGSPLPLRLSSDVVIYPNP